MAKPKQVSISTDTLDEAKKGLEALDAKIAGLKGSASARKAKATEAVNVSTLLNLTPTVGEWIEAIERTLAEAQAFRAMLVDAQLKATSGEGNVALEALVTKRDAEAAKVAALATILGVEVTIPRTPKGLGSGSGGGAKSLKGQWFRHDGAEKTPIAESNSSLGGVAWYWFGKCGADAVKAALAAKGVTALASSFGPVELTVGDKTATVSFEVVEKK